MGGRLVVYFWVAASLNMSPVLPPWRCLIGLMIKEHAPPCVRGCVFIEVYFCKSHETHKWLN